MSKHDYLERWAWKIIGVSDKAMLIPLHERIDVAREIQRWREERETLYQQLNGLKPVLKQYWFLSPSDQERVRRDSHIRR